MNVKGGGVALQRFQHDRQHSKMIGNGLQHHAVLQKALGQLVVSWSEWRCFENDCAALWSGWWHFEMIDGALEW
jgi:hypothetical protein